MIHQYNVRVIHDDETDTVKIGFAHELVASKAVPQKGLALQKFASEWKERSADKMAIRLNKALFMTSDGNTLKPVQK